MGAADLLLPSTLQQGLAGEPRKEDVGGTKAGRGGPWGRAGVGGPMWLLAEPESVPAGPGKDGEEDNRAEGSQPRARGQMREIRTRGSLGDRFLASEQRR